MIAKNEKFGGLAASEKEERDEQNEIFRETNGDRLTASGSPYRNDTSVNDDNILQEKMSLTDESGLISSIPEFQSRDS